MLEKRFHFLATCLPYTSAADAEARDSTCCCFEEKRNLCNVNQLKMKMPMILTCTNRFKAESCIPLARHASALVRTIDKRLTFCAEEKRVVVWHRCNRSINYAFIHTSDLLNEICNFERFYHRSSATRRVKEQKNGKTGNSWCFFFHFDTGYVKPDLKGEMIAFEKHQPQSRVAIHSNHRRRRHLHLAAK